MLDQYALAPTEIRNKADLFHKEGMTSFFHNAVQFETSFVPRTPFDDVFPNKRSLLAESKRSVFLKRFTLVDFLRGWIVIVRSVWRIVVWDNDHLEAVRGK